jgi:hypothetical protein
MTVTGTTAPGARIDLAAGQPGTATNTTRLVATVADSHGNYSVAVPTPTGHGSVVITVAATGRARATGWAQETLRR